MKSRSLLTTDAGHSSKDRGGNKGRKLKPDSGESDKDMRYKQRLLLWDQLELSSGVIRQPWHDKLGRIRRNRRW